MSADATAERIRDEARARLGLVEQRFTSGRRSLVDILGRSDRPLTMPELLVEGPELVQSSVYRNLTVLEEAGVVRRIVTHDEFARFELAEDLTQHHHHHLVCVGCGRVGDITLSEAAEASLDEALHAAANDADFELQHHRLDLVGRCAGCVAAGNRSVDTAAEAM